jgi:sugar lactone lactonase YvrE
MDKIKRSVHPHKVTLDMQATLAIKARNIIGESPVWDGERQRLLWVDQAAERVYEARHDAILGWCETRQWSLGRPLASVIPRMKEGLVIAAVDEILLFDENSNVLTSFARLDIDPQLERLNEAKCDSRGRLWAATLATDFASPRAALYRIDPDGAVTPVLKNVQVGNGFGWSPDDTKFYFTDSMRCCVDVFDFDPVNGTIANRKPLVKLKGCAPDGLTVDRDGCLWIAAAASGEVRRYTPEGELTGRITVATPGVTNCAFGGTECGELLITSIGIRMPDVVLQLGVPPEKLENNFPESGGVFVCRPGVTGAPAARFAA